MPTNTKNKSFHTSQKVVLWDRQGKDWLANWLRHRKRLFTDNARAIGMSANYLSLELRTMYNTPGVTANSIEDYQYYPQEFDFEPMGYAPDGETILLYNKPVYIRYNTRRDIPMWKSNFVHENTHALKATPQEEAISRIYPSSVEDMGDYWGDPGEIYSRLNAARWSLGILPDQVIDELFILKHKNDLRRLNLYEIPSARLIKMFNEVAQNSNAPKQEIYYAKLGTKVTNRWIPRRPEVLKFRNGLSEN